MQQIHEFPQEVLLVGGVVARSAGTSGASRTIGTSRTSRPIGARTSGSIRTAWLGVVDTLSTRSHLDFAIL